MRSPSLHPALLLLAFLVLLGCGHGRGSAPTAPEPGELEAVRIVGIVAPPEGGPAIGDLTVWTAYGAASPDASGAFDVQGLRPGSMLVFVGNASGDVALMGYCDDAHSTIDVHSTAVALLYTTIGAYYLTPKEQVEALALLRSEPEAVELAAVLREAMTTGGATSLAEGTDTIAPAVAAARASLLDPRRRNGPVAIQILPPGERSGIRVDEESAGMLQIVNRFRRRAIAITQRISYVEDDGTPNGNLVETPGEPIVSHRVSPTVGLSSALATVYEIARGRGIYQPVTAAVPVPIEPTDALATNYEVFVAGLGTSGGDWDQLSLAQLEAVEGIYAEAGLFDFMLPIFLNVALPTGVAALRSSGIEQSAQSLDSFRQLTSFVAAVIPQFIEAMRGGNTGDAMRILFEAVLDTEAGRQALGSCIDSVVRLIFRAVGESLPATVLTGAALQQALAGLTVVNIALTLVDTAFQASHVSQSNLADRWMVRSNRGRVTLSPPRARTDPDTPIRWFTATVANPPTGQLRYVWQVQNGHGGVRRGEDPPMATLDTTDNQVEFVPDGSTGDEVLALTVYDPDGELLAETSAPIEIRDAEVYIAPDEVSLHPGDEGFFEALINPLPPGFPNGYTFRWSATQDQGTVSSPILDMETVTEFLEYRVNDGASYGTSDTISVEIFDGTVVPAESVGTATATVLVEERRSVIPGTFQVVIEPTDAFGTIATTAFVVFAPQPDAIRYRVVGDGGFDFAFYGSHIDVTVQASAVRSLGPDDVIEATPPSTSYIPSADEGLVGLSAGFQNIAAPNTTVDWMKDRFGEFRFKVYVTYGP